MKRNFLAGIIGNIFLHYDSTLFGLLAPFMAPHFFPDASPLSALILTYGLLIPGLLSRPLGAFVFGYIGDRIGRKAALFITLLGIAITTFLMGCLPTFSQVGVFAPIFLASCRFLQNFFSGGESIGGAIFVLENAAEKQKSFLSSLFDSSSILGVFLASAIVTLTCFEPTGSLWRIPFLIGGLCGICGFILRFFTSEPLQNPQRLSLKEHFSLAWQHKRLIIPIICAAGFTYTTYTHAFVLMNGFLPFVTTISLQEVCSVNTLLLLFDFLLLPFFGLLAKKVAKERIMGVSAGLTVILAIPLYMLLDGASSLTAIAVRMIIVTLGVAFAATYHHWAQEQIPQHLRYTLVATATSIGASLIGIPSTAISLLLYQKTGLTGAPGLYLAVAAGLALLAVSPVFVRAINRRQAS